ncbi:MAG: peroxiredoxin [Paracoccus sp. (in: a-proteobacteria)]|uniref:peroxiredoxin n=1 Tax=Paracoccus sp. TaxID=267 RepID=UPI0026DF54AA|nr:peroxiredoxin [Paracoccus sp. (in: a-proteobacteria)]MDO5631748.1 peroxiredoxin [Paracoccus sp. (in: a-proteobacteria)]
MTIKANDKLPQGKVLVLGEDGPKEVALADLTKGRVAIFGLPGAFTGTCTNAHMPSFIRTADAFRAKGIDAILCLTVNDPFVAGAWARETGADAAGIQVLADADGSVTKAMGLNFDAPPAGLYGRCKRFAALARDGVFEVVQIEDSPGTCSVSAGEALLENA